MEIQLEDRIQLSSWLSIKTIATDFIYRNTSCKLLSCLVILCTQNSMIFIKDNARRQKLSFIFLVIIPPFIGTMQFTFFGSDVFLDIFLLNNLLIRLNAVLKVFIEFEVSFIE